MGRRVRDAITRMGRAVMTGVEFCPSCGASRWPDARFCGSCSLDIAEWEQQFHVAGTELAVLEEGRGARDDTLTPYPEPARMAGGPDAAVLADEQPGLGDLPGRLRDAAPHAGETGVPHAGDELAVGAPSWMTVDAEFSRDAWSVPPGPTTRAAVAVPAPRPDVGVAPTERAVPATPRRRVHPLAIIGLVLAVLVLAAGGAWLITRPSAGSTGGATAASPLAGAVVPASPKPAAVGSLLAPLQPTPESLIDPANPRALGSASAPVTMEIWSDFQCPACDAFATTIEPDLIQQYVATGKVHLIYRDFAFIDKGAADGESHQAAAAARCVSDKFWPFHDYLFENQNPKGENLGTFSSAFLASVADAVGADRTAYDACMANGAPDAVAAVNAETAQGAAAGVNQTPTIALNGKLLQGGALPMSTLGPAIDALIAAAAGPSAPSSASPRHLGSQVTDDVGALGGATSAVQQALDDLQRAANVQLWVWFTDTTGGLSAPDFATQTAKLNGFGGNDLLLVLAMTDHAYGYWKSDAIPLANARLDTVLGAGLETGLRSGKNGSAIVATAAGIRDAINGTVPLNQTSPNATVLETSIRTFYDAQGFPGQYEMAAVDGLHAHTTATAQVFVVCASYAYRGLNGNADGRDVKSFSLSRSGSSWIVTSFSGLSDYPSLASCDHVVGGSLLP